ncbi:MAG: PPC domain-containing DNA-binding protein [Planctomycetota bacterium]
MNVLSTGELGRLVVVALDPHDMLLESIHKTINEENIDNGIVISGIGTLKNLRMHYIKHTDFPPDDEITNIERPLELVSVSGIIADGEPHLHVVVSCGRDDTFAGHLEEGSEVAYLAEVAILTTPNLNMARKLDRRRDIRLLRLQDEEV